MNAHERALELGAARFDFALTPGETDTLERHLATCLQCRWDVDGMADDDRRIGSRPMAWMSPSRSAVLRSTLEAPGRAMSPAMVLVAAAVLVALAIAAAAVGSVIVQRIEDSRLAIEPAPSSSLPAVVPPSPTPRAWALAEAGQPDPGLVQGPVAVARNDSTWVAVGGSSCVKRTASTMFDCVVPFATSVDGSSWAASGSVPVAIGYAVASSGPEPGIVDLAAGPDGFVAVGMARDPGRKDALGALRGVAWRSADGVTWERVVLDDGARPSAVVHAPDGWLIGGVVYREAGPVGAMWTSTDGRAWTLDDDAAVLDVGGYVDTGEDPSSGGIRAFAFNGPVLVAGGEVCEPTGTPCRPTTWASTDGGATWERSEPLPAGDWLEDLVTANGAFVAVARTCDAIGSCRPVMLRSSDGRSWAEVPTALPEMQALAANDELVIGIVGAERSLAVWASADGSTWESLALSTAPIRRTGSAWASSRAPTAASTSSSGSTRSIPGRPTRTSTPSRTR